MANRQFIQEFNTVSTYLKGFAINLTRDLNKAEDLFQETALRAFRYQKKYTGDTNLKAWLAIMMKNLFINQYRKDKKDQDNKEAKELYYQNFKDVSTKSIAEQNINIGEIEQLINDLDEIYRVPFLLFYEGYKYDEIQKALAPLPMGTIKSRIHVARKKLREQIIKLDLRETN